MLVRIALNERGRLNLVLVHWWLLLRLSLLDEHHEVRYPYQLSIVRLVPSIAWQGILPPFLHHDSRSHRS